MKGIISTFFVDPTFMKSQHNNLLKKINFNTFTQMSTLRYFRYTSNLMWTYAGENICKMVNIPANVPIKSLYSCKDMIICKVPM